LSIFHLGDPSTVATPVMMLDVAETGTLEESCKIDRVSYRKSEVVSWR